MKLSLISMCMFVLVTSCATIPPEYLTAIEKEKSGINFLYKRHQLSITDLISNWYQERLEKLALIKKIEINTVMKSFKNTQEGTRIEAIEKEDFLRIEKQFNEALKTTNWIRISLTERYSDTKNWEKLKALNRVNYTMSRSLLELNQSQRNFFKNILQTHTITIPATSTPSKSLLTQKGTVSATE